jgi:CotS family spore coat protein
MSFAVNEKLDEVLSQYQVNVLDIKNESYKGKKGVWWIKTDKGMKILKKISCSEETIRFLLDAVRHLSSKGVNLPEVHKTKDGREYVCIGESCYTLTEAIEGRNPVYSAPADMELVATSLAKFHKCSEGFFPAEGTKPKYHLGLWIEDYKRQFEEIRSFYRREQESGNPDEIGRIVLKEFPFFAGRAEKAIEGLNGKEYKEWTKAASKTGCLCHQDYAAGNLLISPDGRLYVLDTDSLTVDIAARDIRKLLNKVMKKKGKWDTDKFKRILEYYQSVNPLSADQWKVAILDLLYPHLFFGAVSKYYYKRDKEWTKEKYRARIAEMAEFEKASTDLLENCKPLLPV